MATLKEHQAAMVDLLANGSGIPASASRLAHAMHDVLAYLNLESAIHQAPLYGADATTPGLNDKALADDIRALQVNSPAKWPVNPAERRVKELENTIRQLKANNRALRQEVSALRNTLEFAEGVTTEKQFMAEQAGCRKPDTQCLHTPFKGNDGGTYCADCGEEL